MCYVVCDIGYACAMRVLLVMRHVCCARCYALLALCVVCSCGDVRNVVCDICDAICATRNDMCDMCCATVDVRYWLCGMRNALCATRYAL